MSESKEGVVSPKESIQERVEGILRKEAEGILAIPRDNPFEAVTHLLNEGVNKKGKVVVSGVGKAGDVGRKIVSTFNSTGVSSVFLSPLDAVHGDLGMVQKNDTMFLISNSGKTTEIVGLMALVKKVYPEMKVVCLTSQPKSSLAKNADFVLNTGCTEEVCPHGLTPTTSVITMLAIADVLTVLSMKERGFTAEQYAQNHHGGYLGTKAKKIAGKIKQ